MKNCILICSLALLFTACRKEGFTPPAEGQQIAYQDTLKTTLAEALQQSSAQRFYKAWQRSHLPAMLQQLSDGKTMFTILAPDDAALEKSGYTEQLLQTMDVRNLDSLLMFYVIRQRISKEDLTNRPDDLMAITLLNKPGVRAVKFLTGSKDTYGFDPYYYRQFIQVKDNQMIVNGKVCGAGVSTAAKDGYLWILNKTISVPDKTVLEAMRADGRFTIILELLYTMRRQFALIANEAAGWPAYPEDPTDIELYQPYGWVIRPDEEFSSNDFPNISFSTFFLPSDDAFRAEGFNNVADLMAFNQRKGMPYWNPDWWIMEGGWACDTLLDYHFGWGLRHKGITPSYLNGGLVFYSHMLTTSVVANVPVVGGLMDPNGSGPDPAYYMPYVFTRNTNGQVQMNVKGAQTPAPTLTDTDINTLMGPIHVLDRLLIPKGYKINN